MLTKEEKYAEFSLLTKGILQDSRVDTAEAQVLKRWLEEHREGDEFDFTISKLDKFLSDKYMDRFESSSIVSALGNTLKFLRG